MRSDRKGNPCSVDRIDALGTVGRVCGTILWRILLVKDRQIGRRCLRDKLVRARKIKLLLFTQIRIFIELAMQRSSDKVSRKSIRFIEHLRSSARHTDCLLKNPRKVN